MKLIPVRVALPLVLTIAAVLMGDEKSLVPLLILLLVPVCIWVFAGRKPLAAWKALLVTFMIWSSVILAEQRMNAEMACYRMAEGVVSAGISLIPYIGPVLIFGQNEKHLSWERSPDRITFTSKSPIMNTLSLAGLGMMFAFSFGLLRLGRTQSKSEMPEPKELQVSKPEEMEVLLPAIPETLPQILPAPDQPPLKSSASAAPITLPPILPSQNTPSINEPASLSDYPH